MGYPIAFVGAGPGDPELITVKGRRLLEEADRVVYAGSLVPETLLEACRQQTRRVNSAGLTLEETHRELAQGYRRGERVVRLHTGDPALYGAVQEQMRLLERDHIDYYVVPGVSAAFAAAAELKRSFTLPEISQTVIFTRAEGNTPVPEGERLRSLARHETTLVIYLSVSRIEQVVAELSEHYPRSTPVVVAHRVGWPDQHFIEATLDDIAARVVAAGIRRQALIMVGEVFAAASMETRSQLYSEAFSHGFRHGK